VARAERLENPASAALDAIGDLHEARVYGREDGGPRGYHRGR
jgi:hypothetical protein